MIEVSYVIYPVSVQLYLALWHKNRMNWYIRLIEHTSKNHRCSKLWINYIPNYDITGKNMFSTFVSFLTNLNIEEIIVRKLKVSPILREIVFCGFFLTFFVFLKKPEHRKNYNLSVVNFYRYSDELVFFCFLSFFYVFMCLPVSMILSGFSKTYRGNFDFFQKP